MEPIEPVVLSIKLHPRVMGTFLELQRLGMLCSLDDFISAMAIIAIWSTESWGYSVDDVSMISHIQTTLTDPNMVYKKEPYL
jgi:hypothetical protein